MGSSRPIKLAVDLMSGDNGVAEFMPAVLSALTRHPHVTIIGVGDEAVLKPLMEKEPHFQSGRLVIQHASEVVEMDDSPQSALRNKKDSSMRVAINLVKAKEADACMSAGNTGALMATARFVLKTLPGIDRPAICTSIPSMRKEGHIHMLDLGANVDTNADHLYQFAVMGSLLAAAVNNNPEPKVALLNIGSEAIKGNEQVKEATKLLEASTLNYCGYIEPDGLFFDDVDVAVCDGFVGNVALKTMEGTARLITRGLENSFKKNAFTKLSAVVAMPVLKDLKSKLDPRKHNGASLLGLKGIVVKSHGNADRVSFENAIDISVKLVDQQILNKIETQFAE